MSYGIFENLESNFLRERQRLQILASIRESVGLSSPLNQEPEPVEMKALPNDPQQLKFEGPGFEKKPRNESPLVKHGHISPENSQAVGEYAKHLNNLSRYDDWDASPEQQEADDTINGLRRERHSLDPSHPFRYLSGGVHDWSSSNWANLRNTLDDIHALHTTGKSHTGKLESGDPLDDYSPAAMAHLYEAYRQAPENAPELHRGVRSYKDPNTLDKLLRQSKYIDEPFSSWSEDPDIASAFAWGGSGESPYRGYTPIEFHLPDGGKGLNIAPISSLPEEKEWLSTGPYAINYVNRSPHYKNSEEDEGEGGYYGDYHEGYKDGDEDEHGDYGSNRLRNEAMKELGIDRDEWYDLDDSARWEVEEKMKEMDRPEAIHVHLRHMTPEEKENYYKNPEKFVGPQHLGVKDNIIPFPLPEEEEEADDLSPEEHAEIKRSIHKRHHDIFGILDEHR